MTARGCRLALALVLTGVLLQGAPALAEGVDPVKVATGAWPAIATDQSGSVHLVYARGGKLWYRKRDAATKTWSAEEDTGIAQHASHRNRPRVAVDSRNYPHVTGGKGNGTGEYAWWNGASWQKIEAWLNRDTAIALDSRDNVYIVDRGGNSGGYMGLVRRAAGTSDFTKLPDPDISNGLPIGRSDHVYGSVFVNRRDDSVHVVYRHGAPTRCAYRGSSDGGQNWFGGGVSNDRAEAPSGVAAADGTIYVVTGNGTVLERTDAPSSWKSLGRAVTAGSRHLPKVATDASGNLYLVSFRGKYNVLSAGSWVGEKTVPSLSGAPVGHMAVSCSSGVCCVAWEEGDGVNAPNDNVADSFDIVFATISPQGAVGDGVNQGARGKL